MALLNTFDSKTTEVTVSRLEKLNHTTAPQWGKMNSAQMLAHLNVTYDLAYDKIQPTGNFFTKFLVKILVKPIVVSEKPYKKNSHTAPIFINNIKETEVKGAAYFEGKLSSSFGPMTSKEWSNQFYKHIDHHFDRFGV